MEDCLTRLSRRCLSMPPSCSWCHGPARWSGLGESQQRVSNSGRWVSIQNWKAALTVYWIDHTKFPDVNFTIEDIFKALRLGHSQGNAYGSLFNLRTVQKLPKVQAWLDDHMGKAGERFWNMTISEFHRYQEEHLCRGCAKNVRGKGLPCSTRFVWLGDVKLVIAITWQSWNFWYTSNAYNTWNKQYKHHSRAGSYLSAVAK